MGIIQVVLENDNIILFMLSPSVAGNVAIWIFSRSLAYGA